MIRNANYYRINYEFQKHIKHMFVPYALFVPMFLFCGVLVVLIGTKSLVPLEANYTAVSGDFDYIYKSCENIEQFYGEYAFDYLISISESNGKNMNVNTYMLFSDLPYSLADKSIALRENQIIISKLVANKLGVSIGDKVFLSFPMIEDALEFEIVYIEPEVWNYYNVLQNTDFSVVHIGYSESLESNTLSNMVYFLSEDEQTGFMDANYSYTEHYDLNVERQQLFSRILAYKHLFLSFLILMMLGWLIYNTHWIENETDKYFHNLFDKRFVNTLRWRDYLLFVVIPQVFLILAVYLSGKEFVDFLFFLSLITLIIIEFVAIYIRGRKYEKASRI